MTDENQQAIDEWAEQIANLKPEVVKGVVMYAERLATDGRLSQADRNFAKAQADAVRRATRRLKSRAIKSSKS